MAARRLQPLSITIAALLAVAVAIQSVGAQDLDEDASLQEPVAELAQRKHHHTSFNSSGPAEVTQAATCPAGDTCFSFSGTLHGKPGPMAMTGQGMNSNSKCRTNNNVTCCLTSGIATVDITAADTVSFIFGGLGCGNTTTNTETVFAHLMVTGGSGKFAGATGTGRTTLMDDATSGKGTISASAKLNY